MRAQACRQGREAAQVGHQDRDFALLAAQFEALGRLQNARGHLLGHVPAKGAPDQFVSAAQLHQPQPVQIAQPLLFQRGGDAGAQQGGIKGLGQKILSARLDAFHGVLHLIGAGNDDDRQPAQVPIGFESNEHFHAVHLGHFHVEQHQVEGLREHQFERLSAVGRLGDVAEPEGVQSTDQREPHGAAVVHHQHSRLLQRASTENSGGILGRRRINGQFGIQVLLVHSRIVGAVGRATFTARQTGGVIPHTNS